MADVPTGVPVDAPSIRDEPQYLEREERNAFYESLSIEAKDRFLQALKVASSRGADEQTAWHEAVTAAETAYPPDPTLPEPLAADVAPADTGESTIREGNL